MKNALIAVLLACSLLGCQQKSPEKTAGAADTKKAAIIAERVEGVSPYKVALALEPAQPTNGKLETFRFTVTDAAGKPATGLTASIALVMPIMDMGKNEFAGRETAPGVYAGSGAFNMADEWEVFLSLQQGKDKPAKHVFNVRVTE